jgi:YNFM family putative membrane transporter
VTPRAIWLITFGAYLPASSLAALGALVGPGTGHTLDPALMTVPFCAGFGVGFPLWGALVDRFARTRLMVVSLLLMAAAGVLVALVADPALLAGGRVLAGLAAAGVPPAAQALLAERSAGQAGGRLAGMMVAVGVATLGGPLAAQALAEAGWVVGALVLGSLAPALAAGLAAVQERDRRVRTTRAALAPFRPSRGVLAGWLTAALVLGGYWTVLTRLAVALQDQDAESLTGIVPLIGAIGLPLAVVAGRMSDRIGPRAPMVAATATGAVGFALAAAAPTAVAFAVTAAVGLAFYWAYLPVVAVQVQRSADAESRGRAVGGLYASMWLGAAAAGAAATVAPSWRYVLIAAGACWAVAAVVAARSFQRGPAAGWEASPRPQASLATRPSRA